MIRTERRAMATACIIANSIFSRSVSGPEVTTRISASPQAGSTSSCAGKNTGSSISRPVQNDQSLANASLS